MSICTVCSKVLSKSKYKYCREHMRAARFSGRSHSEESRKKIAETLKIRYANGQRTKRPATIATKKCLQCGLDFSGEKKFVTQRKYCSQSCYWLASRVSYPCKDCGTEIAGKQKKAVRCRDCWKIFWKAENTPQWKGGITPANKLARNTTRYLNWRKAVFERDNYTCQICGARGVEIHADHIKAFAFFVELRYEVSNGRTLCVPCHKETDNYAGRATSQVAKLALIKVRR